jgi:hypothetical protein
MLDAGALSLVVVAFVNADFLPSDLIEAGTKRIQKYTKPGYTTNVDSQCHASSPIPFGVIHASALMLSTSMRRTGFQKSWQDNQFSIRRHLCSLLVDVLLDETEDRHACTRTLFRKVVAQAYTGLTAA